MTLAKEVAVAAEKLTQRKWCSNCQAHKNTAGGVYIPINKGKQKRWKCEACKLP
jgi:hypothetical protein